MRDAGGILYGEVRLMWAAFGGGGRHKDGREELFWSERSEQVRSAAAITPTLGEDNPYRV